MKFYTPLQNISEKLYFFCEVAPSIKSSVSIIEKLFASMDKI